MRPFKWLIEYTAENIPIYTIDFSKPWWSTAWRMRKSLCLILSFSLLDNILWALLPLFLGLILEQQSIRGLILIGSLYLVVEICSWMIYHPFTIRLFSQVIDGFHYNAFRYFLSIDPIYHVHRPTGTILGKIQRTTQAYLDFYTNTLEDLVPFFVQIGAVSIAMFSFNLYLGLLVLLLFVAIGLLDTFIIITQTRGVETEANTQDDITKQKTAESLTQLHFIRASFATKAIRSDLFKTHRDLMRSLTRLFMTHRVIRGTFVSLYIISFTAVAACLLWLVTQGRFSTVMATSLLLTYVNGSREVLSIDKRVKTILTAYRRIIDFQSFIQSFGKQTYPVYPEDVINDIACNLYTSNRTTIECKDITFWYPNQPPLLDHNNFLLTASFQSPNKLYGIIGPSGIGKTTFLSVIGGQLKPEKGDVAINGIDIYAIDDETRQKIIAIQGQQATGMRRSLKYNLLFGLPEESYSDDQLVEILKSVGLWSLFHAKEGLETVVGEGGYSISGGQRQRLSFANLYLRARYYRPFVILIDEPTSSLDEISEHVITEMIEELAQYSITLVIAHRLKTLEQAHGIIDFSLLAPHRDIKIHEPSELRKHSQYYKELLDGVKNLD